MRTKQFMLFAGKTFHPKGGIADLLGSYDTLRDALQIVCDNNCFEPPHTHMWWHIYDARAGGLIAGSKDGPFIGTDGGDAITARPLETT